MTKMKKLLIWTLCVAMLLPAFASFASAKAIPDEDFESSTTQDLKEPDWVGISNNSTSGGAVIEKAPDAIKVIEKVEIPTTKALSSASVDAAVDYGITTISNAPSKTQEVSFDIYLDACSARGVYMSFGNGKASNSTVASAMFTLVFFKPSAEKSAYASYGDSIVAGYVDSSNSAVIVPSFHNAYVPIAKEKMPNGEYMEMDKWYNVKITIAEGASTVELYIDGYKIGDVKAANTDKPIDHIQIQKTAGGGNDNLVYIDNITLKETSSSSPYYLEDFEDYTVGNVPTSKWATRSSYPALKIKEAPLTGKNLALNFVKKDSTPKTVFTLTSGLPTYTNAASFFVYVDSTTAQTGLRFELYGNGGSTLKSIINIFKPNTSDTAYNNKVMVGYYDNNHTKQENLSYNVRIVPALSTKPEDLLDFDKWYHIKLEWEKGATAGTLYVNGVAVCDKVVIDNPSVDIVDTILLQPGNKWNADNIYLDNVKLFGDGSDTPYYQNDFSNETVGSVPQGWSQEATPIKVATISTYPQNVTQAVPSDNALKVYQSGGGQTMTYRNFLSTDKMSVSFDYLVSKASTVSGGYISLSNGTGGKGTWIHAIRLRKLSDNDTTVVLTNGGSTTLATLNLNEWYNMRFDYENGVAKFYLDGKYLGDLPALISGVTAIDGVFFGTTSGASAYDTYYIDNLKFTNAEGIEMNDTPIEFTDTFDTEPSRYTFSSDGHTVANGKLTLTGEITATRSIAPTRSGVFGLSFDTDKLEGMKITLYQDSIEATAIKLAENGSLLCSRDSDWITISDAGKIKSNESVDLSLDLAPDRNANYFTVRVNGETVATALYNRAFSYINKIEISVPEGTVLNVDSLYNLESDGVLQMPEREESSPIVYLPAVIEGAKPMFLAGDNSPSSSTLNYAKSSDKLVLDSQNASIGVDLGSVQPINAIRITGVAEIARPANHTKYSVYQSDDNKTWVKVKGFSMNHFTENGVSVALFEVTGVEARYLKVRCNTSTGLFEVGNPLTSIRAEVRIARQWKMAGNAMYALDDTNPEYTPMTLELYKKAITVNAGDSVGINFGLNSHVEAIELVGSGLSTLDANAFALYGSCDNEKYTFIENVTLSRDTRDGKEVYRLTFPDAVYGYLKLHALTEMNVELADLYDGLVAYSSVEVDSGYVSSGQWRNSGRGGEGDYYTMPDGTLVMVYTGYPIGGVDGDYADNVLKAIQSTDGGYTWGEPWVTLRKQDGNTNLMCASYHYMANGDLAILYIEKLPDKNAHVLLRRSTDFGRSWGEPVCITEEPLGYSILSSAVNGWHLSDGRFVVAINYSYDGSDAHGSDRSVSYMAYSDDDGYTWKKSATAVTLYNAALEPVIAELADGNLIMTMRTRKENSIYQTISTDRGITWAQPVRVENMNTPSSTNSVHTIPATGDLMLVWNDEVYDPSSRDGGNGNRDPLCAAISTDSGLTYKNQRNLVDGGGSWACIRFYGRSMQLQFSSNMKVIDVAELYHTREGSKTIADLPVAATPTATYDGAWLNGVSSTMKYSLDGGKTWSYCGGSSVNIGAFDGDILVKDMGNHEYAPSGTQTVNSTVVLASDLGITQGEVSEAKLNALLKMANEGAYTFKFESGVYKFPKTIELPSNTTLMGGADTVFMLSEGASGKSASPAVISIGNQVDNVRITSLTVKGYNDTVFCPTYAANNIGIKIKQSLRVNIDHVNVVGFADSGIKAEHVGYVFYSDTLNYEERQAYFKNLQLSDCRIEKCYYGLNLGERAEYCQITNLAAGYNNIGCVNSGGNNSFANCFFNKNNTGFYLNCTDMSNPGHGSATACSFNHNQQNALIVKDNKIGFTFTGCQFFDQKIVQTNSYGTIFSGCILGVTLEASGEMGRNLFAGCFFYTDRNETLAGNDGTFTVTDCIDVPTENAVALASESSAEPQMMRLSATVEKPRIYSGNTTLMASDFGVTAGNVSAEALDALIAKAAEGGYTFKFESGAYVFPKTIVLPSNTAIVGDAGTVFMLDKSASGKSATPAVISIGSLVDNVRISNLTIKGHYDGASYPSYVYNTVGIRINSALKVNIDNVTIIGFAESGIKATNMGCNYWDSSLTDDQKQAYFKSLQLTNCRLEHNHIGIELGSRAEYCQITNLSAGYNKTGCINSGGNNSFVNCLFNNNVVGFSLDCAGKSNPGHGGASGCTFAKNSDKAISITENKIGFTFNACNIDGKISSQNSVGSVFNACLIDGQLEATGTAGAGILYGCRIKNDVSLLSGADGIFTVTDCMGFDASSEVAQATYAITSNTPASGKTVEASSLGVLPGKVSDEALDRLVTLAQNGGYTLKFESGVYEFSKSFEIPSNTAVIGCANTVFTLTGANVGKVPVISVSGVENVRLESFIVLGELTQNYIENTSITSKNGSVGIYVSNALRVNIKNVTSKNFWDAAVRIENVGLSGYCETVQISDCRFENSYYGLHLNKGANFCQVVRTVMGYCSAGCLDQGGNNSFANCFFNCNRCGFYVLATEAAGTVVGSSFTHNSLYNARIDNCSSGYSFSGCIYQGLLRQSNSTGIIISSSVLCSLKTSSVSGAAESCLMVGCFFQTDKNAALSGSQNVYKIVDCVEVPAS